MNVILHLQYERSSKPNLLNCFFFLLYVYFKSTASVKPRFKETRVFENSCEIEMIIPQIELHELYKFAFEKYMCYMTNEL